MNNFEFEQTKSILSRYLNRNTRVMDLQCGDNSCTNWIEKTKCSPLVPLAPGDMEHIDHENPFVAYNNFVNDERFVPTNGGKADIVLLLGPLYSMQNKDKRKETLGEVKRLLSKKGKVISLWNYSSLNQNREVINSLSTDKKGIKTEEMHQLCKEELKNAGFSLNEIIDIQSQNPQYSRQIGLSKGNDEMVSYCDNVKKGIAKEKNDYFIAVATPKPVPKPVISVDDIPPEVVLRIPNDIISKLKMQESEYNKTNCTQKIDVKGNDKSSAQQNSKKLSDNDSKEKYISNKEIKPSIDITLQKRNTVHKSIDSALCLPVNKNQQENKGIKMDLPILPKEIIDGYKSPKEENTSQKELNTNNRKDNNSILELNKDTNENNIINNSDKELSPDKLPKREPVSIKPSIDKNLVMRSHMSKRMMAEQRKKDMAKVHISIDKTLQMNIPKINPLFAKPKSRKNGTCNLINTNLR